MPAIFGIPVFEAVSFTGLLGLAVVFFFAYFIKGLVGLGAASAAVLFGTFLLGPHHAVLLGLTTNAISQVQFVRRGVRDGDWKISRPLILPSLVLAALGVWIFGKVDASALTLILGLVLGATIVAEWLNVLPRIARRFDLRAPRFIYTLAGLNGLVSGIAGSGGLFFVAVYLKQVIADTRTFRGTLFLLSSIMVGWRTLLLATGDFMGWDVLIESLMLMPIVALGGAAGSWLYRYLPVGRFYAVFQIVVTGAAVLLVIKGIDQLLPA